MTDILLRKVCFHEAGHAVVATALGLKSGVVTVEPDGNALGSASIVEQWNQSPLAKAIRAIAGAIAEQEFCWKMGLPDKCYMSSSDRELAISGLSELKPSPAKTIEKHGLFTEPFSRNAMLRAREIVEFNWSAIELFAHALYRAGTLEGLPLADAILDAGVKPDLPENRFLTWTWADRQKQKAKRLGKLAAKVKKNQPTQEPHHMAHTPAEPTSVRQPSFNGTSRKYKPKNSPSWWANARGADALRAQAASVGIEVKESGQGAPQHV